MTRAEHLAWTKARAQEYLARGELRDGFLSMVSDLSKHSETRGHPAIDLGMMLFMSGNLDDPRKMAEFIDGFN